MYYQTEHNNKPSRSFLLTCENGVIFYNRATCWTNNGTTCQIKTLQGQKEKLLEHFTSELLSHFKSENITNLSNGEVTCDLKVSIVTISALISIPSVTWLFLWRHQLKQSMLWYSSTHNFRKLNPDVSYTLHVLHQRLQSWWDVL